MVSHGTDRHRDGLGAGERQLSVRIRRVRSSFTGNSHDRHRTSLGAIGNVTVRPATAVSSIRSSTRISKSRSTRSKPNGQAKSLAAPSLLVANNQEAQINVGQQIPIVQTFYNGLGTVGTTRTARRRRSATTGSVQYLNTGVTLDVKPRVNPGGLVYLDIQQEVSNPGAPAIAGGNPPINQRLIQTQVAVQSGETLLLGGLIQDNQTQSEHGLPLISRIPFLRNLFGNTTNHKDRTELIVLITPRVITQQRRSAPGHRGIHAAVPVAAAAAARMRPTRAADRHRHRRHRRAGAPNPSSRKRTRTHDH